MITLFYLQSLLLLPILVAGVPTFLSPHDEGLRQLTCRNYAYEYVS